LITLSPDFARARAIRACNQQVEIEARPGPGFRVMRVRERAALENRDADAGRRECRDHAGHLVMRDAFAQRKPPAFGVNQRINAGTDLVRE
jgi:hypothetical protein